MMRVEGKHRGGVIESKISYSYYFLNYTAEQGKKH